MKPYAFRHNPDPGYIRSLIERAGVSQQEAARRLGISSRMMRYYVATDSSDHRPAPYIVQFALECMALDQSVTQQGASRSGARGRGA